MCFQLIKDWECRWAVVAHRKISELFASEGRKESVEVADLFHSEAFRCCLVAIDKQAWSKKLERETTAPFTVGMSPLSPIYKFFHFGHVCCFPDSFKEVPLIAVWCDFSLPSTSSAGPKSKGQLISIACLNTLGNGQAMWGLQKS